MQKWYQHLRRRWVKGTMRFTGLFDGPKKIVTKKTTQNSPKLTIWRKNWHITLFFQITLITKKVRSRWVQGIMKFLGWFDGPKKIVTKKTAQNSPKSTIRSKNGHITLIFQIISVTKKVRSRWVQGTMKFLGWFDGPKKIVTKKTAQNSLKSTIRSKKWPKTFFFRTKIVRSRWVEGTMRFLG